MDEENKRNPNQVARDAQVKKEMTKTITADSHKMAAKQRSAFGDDGPVKDESPPVVPIDQEAKTQEELQSQPQVSFKGERAQPPFGVAQREIVPQIARNRNEEHGLSAQTVAERKAGKKALERRNVAPVPDDEENPGFGSH